ncbi:hypothetical protein L7F22_067021 [Adiantum nelumboides]|nr:hypothetical protein [Adiantum nelumboides]
MPDLGWSLPEDLIEKRLIPGNIVPYIQKYGKNPVTGTRIAVKDLIKLQFHKNSEGQYQCPVLHKVFTEYTHIVALKTTGNVFSYEAVKELNLKPKNWKDLLTDEPFSRNDIITIQDPSSDAKILTEFDHVKSELKVDDEDIQKMKDDTTYNMNISGDTKAILQELGTERAKETAKLGGGGGKAQHERAVTLAVLDKAREKLASENGTKNPEMKVSLAPSVVDAASASVFGRSAAAAKASSQEKTAARVAAHFAGQLTPVNAKMVKSQYTSGRASRSFTSTIFDPVTVNDYEYVPLEKNPKKKGYVRLHTTHGDLNLEVHCDIAPRTCENFLTLCERGYYNGVIFHRNIRNFMIQGGDPTGTGNGGESIWGKSFKDEFNSKLLHTGRGVVSMANSGPHSNASQFFILYKSAPHLNYKHTVFGRVVGGLDVLSIMDKVAVDDDDRPLQEIKILQISIFVNPYTEPDDEEDKPSKVEENDEDREKVGTWYSNPVSDPGLTANDKGVGKYLRTSSLTVQGNSVNSVSEERENKKQKVNAGVVQFKDFSAW